MQVTETFSDGLRRAYTVVVPASDLETRRAARLSELGRTLRIPGFRPGKVPMSLVRQRYGTAVQAEVFEESVNEATRRMVNDRGLRPAMQPKVDVVSLGADSAQDLEFKIELEILPDITVPPLGEIVLTRLKAEVAAESVDRALAEIAGRNRKLVELPEDERETHAAETGDVATVDFLGKVDGVPFPGGAGDSIDIEVGGGGFIPGFTEQLSGVRAGEERTIEVTFPEGYGSAELAGKAATFDIKIKQLRRAELPAIDNAFAEQLGFGGLEEVRLVITQRMQREYDQLGRMKLKRLLLDALSDRADFKAPEGMLEAEFEQIWQRVKADLDAGKLDEDDKDKDEETLRGEYRVIADRRVRLGLLLSEIGRANAITVGADEMTRAMRTEASRYPGQEAQVMEFFRKNPQAADGLRGPLFEDKVVDYVLELVQISDEVVSPEELARAVDA